MTRLIVQNVRSFTKIVTGCFVTESTHSTQGVIIGRDQIGAPQNLVHISHMGNEEIPGPNGKLMKQWGMDQLFGEEQDQLQTLGESDFVDNSS